MPHEPLILAIDQGTTNTKAILVDGEGSVVAGWVHQDASAIGAAVRARVDEVIESAVSPALQFAPVEAGTSPNCQ